MKQRPGPQAYENDFLPGWEANKKNAPKKFLERRDDFIAKKRKIIEKAKKGK